jgi:hypothetical protein
MIMKEVLNRSSNVDQDLESEDGHGLEREFPFLRYAITHWVSHAEVVEAKQIPQGDLLGLFQWPSNQILQSWARLYQIMDRYSHRCPTPNMTLLHVASRYCLFSVVTVVLDSEDNVDTDSKDSHGWTPLFWAARNGHEAVVRLLLENGADTEMEITGVTPLAAAIENKYEAVIKLLVAKGAKVDYQYSPYVSETRPELSRSRY